MGWKRGRAGNGDAASVRSEKVLGLQWVQFPPGNWVAPAGRAYAPLFLGFSGVFMENTRY